MTKLGYFFVFVFSKIKFHKIKLYKANFYFKKWFSNIYKIVSYFFNWLLPGTHLELCNRELILQESEWIKLEIDPSLTTIHSFLYFAYYFFALALEPMKTGKAKACHIIFFI